MTDNLTSQSDERTVRPAKKNWFSVKRKASISLQLQLPQSPPPLKPEQVILIPEGANQLKDLMDFRNLTTVPQTQGEALCDVLTRVVSQSFPSLDLVLLKKLLSTIRVLAVNKSRAEPTIVPLLTMILSHCELTRDAIALKRLLDTLVSLNEATLKQWLKILSVLGKEINQDNFDQLLKIHDGLRVHSLLINELGELFTNPPYPKLEHFIRSLDKNHIELKFYCEAYDRDPKEIRTARHRVDSVLNRTREQVIAEQFDTSQVGRVIANIQNLLEQSPLSGEQQYELAQQVMYITAIGKEFPLTVEGATYIDLTKPSRAKLRQLADQLIAKIRDPRINPQEKLKCQLNLLAVMREQYERTTGEFVDTTQLSLLLLLLHDPQQNKLIETDWDKKIQVPMPILAAMLWASTNGTVDVCAANKKSAFEHYYAKGAVDFFTSLGIPSALIKADSAGKTYQIGGINYSTFADLALYSSRVLIDGELLSTQREGQWIPNSCLFEHAELSSLSGRMTFDFTSPDEEEMYSNPHIWIYPLVNAFIQQNRLQHINHLSAEDEIWSEEHIIHVREFLEHHALTEAEKTSLKEVPDNKLGLWLNASCFAHQLVEGEDFTISQQDSPLCTAIPLKHEEVHEGFIFPQGIQQFLHALLQKKYPDQYFPIMVEAKLTRSVSMDDLFAVYKGNGCIMGIVQSMGAEKDISTQCEALTIDTVYRIPPHHKRQDEHDTQATVQSAEYIKKIQRLLAKRQLNQPVLIVAEHARQVQLLQRALSRDGLEIGIFTGEESDKERQHWAKNKAGNNNTITIATPALVRELNFDTEHSKGFLTIQTCQATFSDVKQVIRRVGCNGKPGQYTAVYEQQGGLYSRSWFYQSKADKKTIISALGTIYHTKNEEAAIEAHYRKTVLRLQEAVLQQFEEWRVFLQTIYPIHELKQLDRELLTLREELLIALDEQWETCLAESDLEKKYPNPYVRRGADKKLKTRDLEKALEQYTSCVDKIWLHTREELQKKTENRIEEGTLESLRYYCLNAETISNQVQLNRWLQRQHKKAVIKEKQKAGRLLMSGLDVYGAMLRYGDGHLDEYKLPFIENQIRLLAQDIIKEIQRSSLAAEIKAILIERVKNARTLIVLESVLIEYDKKWLNHEQHFAEKYRMQPVIAELLKVYQKTRLRETEQLRTLKTSYLNNASFDVVTHLEQHFFWAMPDNWSLFFWLERTAVKTAAREILDAVTGFKNAADGPDRQAAIKNLYKILILHQTHLADLWIFSFGHKNTRDVINETLHTLNGLAVLSDGAEQLNAEFIQKCEEEGHNAVMMEQFNQSLATIENNNEPWLANNIQWQQIKQEMAEIQANNNTVYGVEELYYFLSRKSNELHQANSPLFKSIIELRGEARIIWSRFSSKNQSLLQVSSFFQVKAKQIQEILEEVEGYSVFNVSLSSGHMGFSEHIDLVIEGRGGISVFDGFNAYHSQDMDLKRHYSELAERRKAVKEQIVDLQKLQQEQLPLLKLEVAGSAQHELFPESCHELIIESTMMKYYVEGYLPEDLHDFPLQVRDNFLDRDLLKKFDFATLNLEQINQLHDESLRKEFLDLYHKLNSPKTAEPTSLLTKLFHMINPLQEASEDLAYAFDELKGKSQGNLRQFFALKINEKVNELMEHMATLQRDAVSELGLFEKQLRFLQKKIDDEHLKSLAVHKRFNNREELYDFEATLRQYRELHLRVDPDDIEELMLDDDELFEEVESMSFAVR